MKIKTILKTLSLLGLAATAGCDVGDEFEDDSVQLEARTRGGVFSCQTWEGSGVTNRVPSSVACYNPMGQHVRNVAVKKYYGNWGDMDIVDFRYDCGSNAGAERLSGVDAYGTTCFSTNSESTSNCDYRDADRNGGYGWDPVARKSCAPR